MLNIGMVMLCVSALTVRGHSNSHAEDHKPLKSSGECEWINLPICSHLIKSWTTFPNILGHTNQLQVLNSTAYRFLEQVSDVLGFRDHEPSQATPEEKRTCEIEVQELSCRILAPRCYYMDRVAVSGVPPCARVCRSVKEKCEGILHNNGIEWPRFLHCEEMVECHLTSVCLPEKLVLRSRFQTTTDVSPFSTSRKKSASQAVIRFRHHDEKNMRKALIRLVRKCPDIMRFYKIGHSVKKRPLYVLEVSENPGKHKLLKPEVKYVGGIHGNEVLGKELLIELSQFLCKKWQQQDPNIVELIKSTRIHLFPCMNPDGYAMARKNGGEQSGWLTGRFNRYNFDLNRNFPDLTSKVYQYEKRGGMNHHLKIPENYYRKYKQAQVPEIFSVIKWLDRWPFVLSGQLHGGELVANYPYDIQRDRSRWMMNTYSSSPDDALFRHLAETYAQTHKTMADPNKNLCEEDFGSRGGITNGAEWYTVYGGMQDFNYLYSNSFEILMELSCDKFIPSSDLMPEWINNRNALLKYMQQAHIGIKGLVTDLNGVPVENAEIQVEGINHHVTTTNLGEYWRLLVPGNYTVTAVKGRYHTTKHVSVLNAEVLNATRLDFTLEFREENHRNQMNTQSTTHEDVIVVKYPADTHAGHHEKRQRVLRTTSTPIITTASSTMLRTPEETSTSVLITTITTQNTTVEENLTSNQSKSLAEAFVFVKQKN